MPSATSSWLILLLLLLFLRLILPTALAFITRTRYVDIKVLHLRIVVVGTSVAVARFSTPQLGPLGDACRQASEELFVVG